MTFVPATGFSGTVSIPYIAMATNGTTNLTGTIQITVSGGSMNITYSTAQNTPKTFAAADFYTPFANATGYALNYIYFTSLPYSSYGTLYYGYSSASSPGTAVSASSAFYYSSSPSISAVTFVPATGFSGTVSILILPWPRRHHQSYRTIQITVSGGSVNITYTTARYTENIRPFGLLYADLYGHRDPLYYIYFSFAAVLVLRHAVRRYTRRRARHGGGTARPTSTAVRRASPRDLRPASGFSGTVSIPMSPSRRTTPPLSPNDPDHRFGRQRKYYVYDSPEYTENIRPFGLLYAVLYGTGNPLYYIISLRCRPRLRHAVRRLYLGVEPRHGGWHQHGLLLQRFAGHLRRDLRPGLRFLRHRFHPLCRRRDEQHYLYHRHNTDHRIRFRRIRLLSDVGATYSWASQEIDYLYD